MNIVSVGSPGAGKGTPGPAPRRRATASPTSPPGDLLRAAVAAQSELGVAAKKYMDAGELVPDQLVIDLVKERLAADDAQKGFILDGFPRNTTQAVTLDTELAAMGRELDGALLVDVPAEVIIGRLSSRRTCRALRLHRPVRHHRVPVLRRRDVSARR
ncbi:MAG: nucleoside monophosphate kinase [Collinsella sp.]